PDAVQDPWEKNEPGLGIGRDPQRTPMQWSPGRHAGFSEAAPWLPLSAEFEAVNVETLRQQPQSILSLYRALIDLRKEHAALRVGDLRLLRCSEDVLVYERSLGAERIVVALN